MVRAWVLVTGYAGTSCTSLVVWLRSNHAGAATALAALSPRELLVASGRRCVRGRAWVPRAPRAHRRAIGPP